MKDFLICQAKGLALDILLGAIFFGIVFLLSGCASPTKDLYKSTQATCPKTCDNWTGAIVVTEDFIKCVCSDARETGAK